jgi:predicted RNA-binding Zn ribbon-like protein
MQKDIKMVIQLRDVTETFVETLKAQTGQSTASKAFIHTAEQFETNQIDLSWQAGRIEELELQLKQARAIIEGARSAAALLLDRTAQADIFDKP